MNVRPLSEDDLRPYTITTQVFAVRLYRLKKLKWLGGLLGRINQSGEGLKIRFDRFIEIDDIFKTTDPNNPGGRLFANFRVVNGSISQDGIKGTDQRALLFTNPERVLFDNFPPDITLSVNSNEYGSAVVSAREEDVRAINQLFKQLSTERVAVAPH